MHAYEADMLKSEKGCNQVNTGIEVGVQKVSNLHAQFPES